RHVPGSLALATSASQRKYSSSSGRFPGLTTIFVSIPYIRPSRLHRVCSPHSRLSRRTGEVPSPGPSGPRALDVPSGGGAFSPPPPPRPTPHRRAAPPHPTAATPPAAATPGRCPPLVPRA